MKSTTPCAALGVCMGKTIARLFSADCGGNHLRIAQIALAQSALPPPFCWAAGLSITFARALEELQDLRLARPLSRNEVLALRPFDQFKECERCPEMIVVPAGRFLMGANGAESGKYPDEAPQHEVSFWQTLAHRSL